MLSTLLLAPLVLPPVVTGYLLLAVFGRHGPFAALGHEVAFSRWGAVAAAAVVGFPLLIIMTRTAIESVDPRYEQLAETLGRAVLSEPDALLCDEPFSALDAARRRRLVGVLARLRDALEIPLVLVSHTASEVLALAGEVAVLEAGRLVAHGPTHGLLAALAQEDASALNFWEGVVLASDADAGAADASAEPGTVALRAVRVGPDVILHAPLVEAATGVRVRLSVSPSAVNVALAGASDPRRAQASPRNRLLGSVAAVEPQAGLLRVTVEAGVAVTALVTPEAAGALGLSVGLPVAVAFKAASLRILSVSGRLSRQPPAPRKPREAPGKDKR